MLGGTSRTAFSESRAEMLAPVPGTYTAPPPLDPAAGAPARPYGMAHADAQQEGVQYSNLLVGVSSSTVYSRCDVNLVDDALAGGVFADAYGRGGIQDLTVTVPAAGLRLDLTALELEMLAQQTPAVASATWTCDLADVGVNGPPSTAAVCALPVPPVGVPPIVTVTYNEINPVAYDASNNRWVYSGSHLHVHVSALAATADVYVGHVEVGVPATVPAAPPSMATYVPHTLCLTPLCT